jgi:hypothetical protein
MRRTSRFRYQASAVEKTIATKDEIFGLFKLADEKMVRGTGIEPVTPTMSR